VKVGYEEQDSYVTIEEWTTWRRRFWEIAWRKEKA